MASNTSVRSSSSSSSSSCSQLTWTYDVFVSFRVEDARNNFTGFLFQALCRKGIKIGDSTSREMLQVIERSRLFIVVFSKNNSSSTWCLRQLAHIYHCIQTSPRIVLPVFYDVDPSEVLKQSECYEKAFAEHQENFKENKKMMKEVQTWKEALTQVANLAGWDIRNKSQINEITEIRKIVQEIMNKIGHKISTIPNETGEDRYKKLSRLMRIKDFISILLSCPMKLEEGGIFKSWISAFPEWKALLLSADDDTLINKSWRGLTLKVLRRMEGFVPTDITRSHLQRMEGIK